MKRTATTLVSLTLCASLVSSCATQRQTQLVGGFTIGALLGLAASLVDDDSEPAAWGAIGGAIGLGTMFVIQASEDRLASSDVPVDRDRWSGGPVAGIDRVTIEPAQVQPGQSLKLLTAYHVLPALGESSATVEETWTLRRDGKEIALLGSRDAHRIAGHWETSPELTLPPGAEPGHYEVEHRIRVEGGFDTAVTAFEVAS